MSFATGASAYARLVGRYTPALAAAFCDALGIPDAGGASTAAKPGPKALDVGCGSGALLGELAGRLGIDQVAGVDPSEPFLELARAAVPDADIRLASAEALPFDDGAFDLAMSQLVVNFMTDAHRGVSEMRRVARGTVAACTWDYADGMTMLRAFFDAALELTGRAPMRRTCVFSPADSGAVGGLGLKRHDGELVVTADYADYGDLVAVWLTQASGLHPVASMTSEAQRGPPARLARAVQPRRPRLVVRARPGR
jgi:SAM-dependent methyltransferase